MEGFRAVDLVIYAECILIYIIINIHRSGKRKERSIRLFLYCVYSLLVVNMLEGVTWAINGLIYPGGRQISFITNTVLLLCNSLPAVTWVAYADNKIFSNAKKLKKRVRLYLIPFYMTAVLLILNIWNGFVFTIDENNVYARGPGVYIISSMIYILVICLYFATRKYKKQINGKITQSILLFMLFPVVGGIIQMFAYGVLLVWPSFIFASLIAFFQIEREEILCDPLTGLTLREQMEQRAQYLMNKKIAFFVIMIDMDGFKSINDQYGHHEGDLALITAASFLRNSVR
ncbi:MAG TPA: GGDEF domain-containing protein, partial [Lachnospiraceae bacterium]|nr:GGDEF domain-containing protein [Lachnospiraceae bacterium]